MRTLGILTLIFGGMALGACSVSKSSNAGCRALGYFTDQASCQLSTSLSCAMTTVQSSADSKSMVCWKPSSQGLSVTTTGSGTTSGTSGCSGAYPWTLGDWAPATCDGSSNQQVRSVTCPFACPCNLPSTTPPATVSQCPRDLYGQQHYSMECPSQGGAVINMQNGDKICKFNSTGCPSGWTLYKTNGVGWTATKITSATERTNCGMSSWPVYTGFHNFSASPVESKDYCDPKCFGSCKKKTVYATVTQAGCY